MRLVSMLRKTLGEFSNVNRKKRSGALRRSLNVWRPRLEALEDRVVPVVWDGGPTGLGTDWHTPANWVGDMLPGAMQDADIPGTFSNVTITSTQDVTIRAVTSAARLTISNGTFSVLIASSINNNFTLSGGTLTGAGTFTISSGQFTWSGGTMEGAGQTVIGSTVTGAITGNDGKSLGRTLTNAGNVTYNGTGLSFGPSPNMPGTIANNGTFTATGDGDFQEFWGGAHAFNNNGTFTRNGSLDTRFVGVAFNNNGANVSSSVNLQAGILDLAHGGNSNRAINIGSGTTLLVSGINTYAISGGTVSGLGTLRLNSSGTLNLSANQTITNYEQNLGTLTNSGSLTVSNTFALSGGTITGAGNVTISGGQFTWSGGSMEGMGQTILNAGVTSVILGGDGKFLGRTLINGGTVTYNGTGFSFGPSPNMVGTISNNGTFIATGGGDFSEFWGGAHAFNNNGTFMRNGTQTTRFVGVTLNNTGANALANVFIQSGVLELASGGGSSRTITIGSGATLHVTGGTYMISSGAVSGLGTLHVSGGTLNLAASQTLTYYEQSGGTLTNSASLSVSNNFVMTGGNLTGSGNVTVIGGPFTWSGGTMEGTGQTVLNASVAATILGDGGKFLGRTLTNAGTITYNGMGLSFGPSPNMPGTITNNGTFIAFGDGDFTEFWGGAHAFNNNGTFARQGPLTTRFIGVAFNNMGANASTSVSVQSGILEFVSGGSSNRPISILVGTTLLISEGTYTISGGTVSGFGTLGVSGGTLNLATNQTIANYDQSGGTLANAGSFTVSNSFTMSNGTLAGAGNATSSGGQFIWSGGTMEGNGQTIVNMGVTATIVGGNAKLLGRTLTNTGTLTYNGTGLLFGPMPGSVGTLINNGTFTAAGDGDFLEYWGGAHAFTNNGTFTRNGTLNTLFVGVAFTNNGTVNVQSGTLQLLHTFTNFNSGTSTLTGGTYVITSTFQFTDANIVTNAASIVLDSPGSTIISQTLANALANFNANSPAGSFAIRNGRDFATPGNFTNNGTLNVGAGTTLSVTGDLTNFNNALNRLTGGTYVVAGTLRFTGANIVINEADITLDGTASRIQNQTGGTHDALANFATNNGPPDLVKFTIRNGRNLATAGAFSNAGALIVGAATGAASGFTINGVYTAAGTTTTLATGTLTLALGSSNSFLSGAVAIGGSLTVAPGQGILVVGTYIQTGSATIGAGGLLLLGGGGSNSGAISVSDGAAYDIFAGNFSLNNGTAVSGNGYVRVSGGTVTIATALSVPNFDISGGTLTGTTPFTVTGSFLWSGGTMSGAGSTNVSATAFMAIFGSATKTLDTRTFNLAGVADWVNGNLALANAAAASIQSTGLLLIESDQSVTGTGAFANGGTIIKLTTSGTTTIATGVTFTSTNFLWLLTGTFEIAGGTYAQLNGAVTALEVGTVLKANVTLMSGSVLQGSGTVMGNLINDAVVLVGNTSGSLVGLLTVTGNYTQAATGTLLIQLQGTAPVQYDRLVVTGSVVLDGVLIVDAGFAPPSSTMFHIISSASLSGVFVAISLPSDFTISYSATQVVVTKT